MPIPVTLPTLRQTPWGIPLNTAVSTVAGSAQTAEEVTAIAQSVADATFEGIAVDLGDAVTATNIASGPLTSAALAAPIEARTPGFFAGPQARFLARLGKRDTDPVVVLLCGTSQVEGIADNEWPAMLSKAMQATWPRTTLETSPTIRTMDDYIADPTLTAGVQVIDAGVSGSTAATMLPGSYQGAAEALAPYVALFIIDIGTNDKETGVSPATFATNLRAELNPVFALAGPSAKVFVHGNERLSYGGGANPANWDEYRAQKAAIVAESPSDRLLLDLSETLRDLGVGLGGADPCGLLQDTVHYSDAGNLFYFEALANALQLPRGGSSGSSGVGSWVTAYSDGFTGGDDSDINARAFDNTLGGSGSHSWVNASAGSVAIVSGKMTKGATAGNWFAGRAAASDVEAWQFKLDALPTGTALSACVARVTASGGAINGVTMTIATSGAVGLTQRDSTGSSGLISGTLTTLVAGDVVRIERRGLDLRILRNGTLVGTATMSSELASNLNFGFSGASTCVSWTVAQVLVDSWVLA